MYVLHTTAGSLCGIIRCNTQIPGRSFTNAKLNPEKAADQNMTSKRSDCQYVATIRQGSPRSMPTINPQVTASHEAACVTDQEYGCTSIFLWLAQFTQHVLRWPVPSSLWKLLKECFHHSRDNIAW